MSAKPLRKGDKVVMHTCGESEFYDGRIWTCRTDEEVRYKGQGVLEQRLVFLEDFSGSFDANCLQKVNM